jgi:hypothetical protein
LSSPPRQDIEKEVKGDIVPFQAAMGLGLGLIIAQETSLTLKLSRLVRILPGRPRRLQEKKIPFLQRLEYQGLLPDYGLPRAVLHPAPRQRMGPSMPTNSNNYRICLHRLKESPKKAGEI